jgi:carbohydrate diacid regulator
VQRQRHGQPGLILGSGEPERINTRHEGAQLVLANGRIVELDVDAAKCLKGVQPGSTCR